jgi:hypothetical protein
MLSEVGSNKQSNQSLKLCLDEDLLFVFFSEDSRKGKLNESLSQLLEN